MKMASQARAVAAVTQNRGRSFAARKARMAAMEMAARGRERNIHPSRVPSTRPKAQRPAGRRVTSRTRAAARRVAAVVCDQSAREAVLHRDEPSTRAAMSAAARGPVVKARTIRARRAAARAARRGAIQRCTRSSPRES
jgi:hypothetical protein